MGCHQPIHCMPGFGNLGYVAPFVSHTHSQFWGPLPDLAALTLWTVPQLLLPNLTRATGFWCVGWWPWNPSLGLQLSSDLVFPGFQACASLSSLGKGKYSTGWCSCSVLCSLQRVISICLCLLGCPALPGCYFACNGRIQESGAYWDRLALLCLHQQNVTVLTELQHVENVSSR